MQSHLDQLKKAFLQNRLSHAYLLSGVPGTGKMNCALTFAKWVMCESHAICGKCKGCMLMEANHHPDFILISPEEKSHTIKIDQIRQISEKLSHTAHQGGYQIVIISPADAMPVQAANALLKTLEEPNGKIVIFLIDHQHHPLPATVLSRCQQYLFLSGNIDLRLYQSELKLRDMVLQHVEKITEKKANSILFPAELQKLSLEAVLSQCLLLAADIEKIKLQADKKYIVNHDQCERLKNIANKTTLDHLQTVIKKLFEKKALVARGINLNQQLCLEDIFITWELGSSF